jgi:hypothetical protein
MAEQQFDTKQFDEHLMQLFHKKTVKNLQDDIKKREESLRRDKYLLELEELGLIYDRQALRSMAKEYERRYPPSKPPG